MCSFVVFLLAPATMTTYFYRNYKNLREKSFLKRFSSVVENLNYRSKFSSFFISIFCYRRLFLQLLLVFGGKYPAIQIMTMVFMNNISVIIFGVTKLIAIRKLEYLEYFNEIII
jgi:hypothetical protein